ncbi:MAG: protein kinase [Pirellulales bacterium]
MSLPAADVQAIFGRAVEFAEPAERAQYIASECGDNAALRAEVESLLVAYERAENFLATAGSSRDRAVNHMPVHDVAGSVIGPYKLLQQIGEGGFGAVYMAEQTEPLKRRVALKIIKPGLDSRQVLARFEAERQALALMDHPNIAKILDGGATADGRPYFVMELVKGVPITMYCDEKQKTLKARLELFIPVCQAVQHAHQKGVIHRDLKPSNVLVAPYDGIPVVKVIDFGVAKATGQRLTERTLFTEFGAVVGTLEYMSPEQAELNNQDIDTRSDVYSLGVLLYELLTGTTPLDRTRLKQTAFAELLRVIREEEPPKPSTRLSGSKHTLPAIAAQRQTEPARLAKLVRGEMDWVVMKCLDKDRNCRYETAAGLARDLQRYLEGEAVLACPPSAGYRLRKFVRRNKRLLATGSLALVALLAMLALFIGSAFTLRLQVALDDAESQRQKAEVFQYFHHIAVAQSAWYEANLGRARQLLDDCPRDQRGWEWACLDRLCRGELLTIPDHTGWYGVHSVAFSPDGARIAVASGNHVKVCDARTGRVLRLLQGHSGRVYGVAFSPDGRTIASTSADKTLRIWDAANGQEEHTISGDGGGLLGVAFSPDGTRVVSGSTDHNVLVWEIATGRRLRMLPGHSGEVRSVMFSPDGTRLASASTDSFAKLWDADTGSELHSLKAGKVLAFAVAFSPDGTRLATGGDDNTLRVWDVTTGSQVYALRCHGSVESLAFSPDERWLVAGQNDRTMRVWNVATREETRVFRGHTSNVTSVAFRPDGVALVSASLDGTAKVWDVTTNQEPLPFSGGAEWATSVAFSPDSMLLASTSKGSATVKVWDTTTGQLRYSLDGHRAGVWSAAFSPDGALLASASEDGTVRLWDTVTGKPYSTFTGHQSGVSSVGFSPDGRKIASGTGGVGDGDKGPSEVVIWDVSSLQVEQRLLGHKAAIVTVAFSPDGRRLATASHDRTVRVWDTATGKEAFTLQGHTASVIGVSFSPDGSLIASGSWDTTVKIWDARTGAELQTLRGHNNLVTSVAFTPDGSRLASASGEQTVKIWDIKTGQEALTLRGYTSWVWSLAFSADGKRLAAGCGDGTLRFWDTRRWTVQAAAEREAVGLLDSLFAKPLRKADVIEYLKKSPAIRPEARQMALAWVERYHEETDAKTYHDAAEPVIRHPNSNALMCEFAVAQMETACELAPDNAAYRIALGVAQYRHGKFQKERYAEAVATLTKCDQEQPTTLAFLALAQHELGHTDEARATLARLQESRNKEHDAEDDSVHAYVREAQTRIGSQ